MRRFVQAGWNRLQASQVNDHRIAERFPNTHDNDGHHRRVRIIKPLNRIHAKHFNHSIQNAEGRVINPQPDHRNGHHRGDVRNINAGPGKYTAKEFAIQQNG
ncbi:hypothetical protein D3C77_570200 [compost metagenome]